MTDGERIEYLYGRIEAIHGAVLALLITSQDAPKLLSVARTVWEARAGGQLHSNVSDAFLKGVQETREQLQAVLERTAEGSGTRKGPA